MLQCWMTDAVKNHLNKKIIELELTCFARAFVASDGVDAFPSMLCRAVEGSTYALILILVAKTSLPTCEANILEKIKKEKKLRMFNADRDIDLNIVSDWSNGRLRNFTEIRPL